MRLAQEQALTLKQKLDQRPSISTRVKDYEDFLNITRDDNPLHTDEDYASKTPFKGLVVPGLYFALKAEGSLPKDIAGLDLMFKAPVQPGNDVKFLIKDSKDYENGIISITWYMAAEKEPEVAIEGKARLDPAKMGPAKNISESENDVHVYHGKAEASDIEKMMQIAMMIGEPKEALNLHSAGYVSPALLKFAQDGATGAYMKQGFRFYSQLRTDEDFKVIARHDRTRIMKGTPVSIFSYIMHGSDGRPVLDGAAWVAGMK